MKEKPLYFYHLVNKNASLEKGLLSLQYMYDHEMFELFDKSVIKYKKRILNDWGYNEFSNKDDLTREDYIKALKMFRGDLGTSYIYFFRYPPFSELGPNMDSVLKEKDIYRIDINNSIVKEHIKDIFYGYDMSSSDNPTLDKTYYENISEDEYFSKYDDKNGMIFKNLNHISIAFKDDYCPINLLEKIKTEKN